MRSRWMAISVLGVAALALVSGMSSPPTSIPNPWDPANSPFILSRPSRLTFAEKVGIRNRAWVAYKNFTRGKVLPKNLNLANEMDLLADLMGPRSEAVDHIIMEELPMFAQYYWKKALVQFPRACEPGKKMTLLAVGDVLLHSPLAVQGLKHKDGFRSLWAPVASYIENADVAYANLEGPTAGNIAVGGRIVKDPGRTFDRVAYTSYPAFNYHPSLSKDLLASGFDIVSTANNHALDRGGKGIDRTIEALRDAGMPFTGTIESTELAEPKRTAFTHQGGMKLAWIACTFSTNGIRDPKSQVLNCYSQKKILMAEIRKQKADPTVDAVVVTPHWGTEYDTAPDPGEKRLAREMVEAGALLVLGAHPHVLQPMETVKASDGHEGFIIYSLGNFVSGQSFKLSTKTAALVFIGLTKSSTGEVFVNGVRHLPTTMSFKGGISVKPAFGNFEPSRAFANEILMPHIELKPGEKVVTNPRCFFLQ